MAINKYTRNDTFAWTDRPLSSFESSKINEHAFESKDPISDYSFNILSNSTVLDLEVFESLYIHTVQPNLNDYDEGEIDI